MGIYIGVRHNIGCTLVGVLFFLLELLQLVAYIIDVLGAPPLSLGVPLMVLFRYCCTPYNRWTVKSTTDGLCNRMCDNLSLLASEQALKGGG